MTPEEAIVWIADRYGNDPGVEDALGVLLSVQRDADRLTWAQENLLYVHQDMGELFQITYVGANGGPKTLGFQESLRTAIDEAMKP